MLKTHNGKHENEFNPAGARKELISGCAKEEEMANTDMNSTLLDHTDSKDTPRCTRQEDIWQRR